jgi:hypothetical protein
MKNVVLTLDEQKRKEQEVISGFVVFFSSKKDFSRSIYDMWTAKDVLGHVTSWHMSFSRNLIASVQSIKPTPFKGSLSDVNDREVILMSQFSVNELIQKINIAQKEIIDNIGNPDVKSIAYKKGSRDYSPIEHLEVVRRHVNSHLIDLKAKYLN